VVILKDGTMVWGKLGAVAFDRLTIEEHRASREILQTDVRNVFHLRRRIGRTTWKGTVIGYKATWPLRAILAGRPCSGGRDIACGIIVIGAVAATVAIIPIGMTGGLAVGLIHQRREPVYGAYP
jgi:hypothetical protein